MPRDLRSAALHYLRSGAVTIVTASTPPDGPRVPLLVEALVVGHRSTHRVHLKTGEGWRCSCRYDGCAHLAAVQLVTGAGTDARRAQQFTAPALGRA